MSHFS